MFLYSSYHNSLSNLPPPSSLFSLHFTVSLFLSPLFLTTFCFQFIFLLFSTLYNYTNSLLCLSFFFSFLQIFIFLRPSVQTLSFPSAPILLLSLSTIFLSLLSSYTHVEFPKSTSLFDGLYTVKFPF